MQDTLTVGRNSAPHSTLNILLLAIIKHFRIIIIITIIIISIIIIIIIS
jgi:hypothetical protein